MINGQVEYDVDYNCDREDYEAVKQVYQGAGVRVAHVSPIADLQLDGGERAILLRVKRKKPMKTLDPRFCLLVIGETGTKYYSHTGGEELPETKEEFCQSLLEFEIGNELARKRMNLFKLANRFASTKDADHVVKNSLVEIVNQTELEDGSLELEIEYGDQFEEVVAKRFETEDVTEEQIRRFIDESIKNNI